MNDPADDTDGPLADPGLTVRWEDWNAAEALPEGATPGHERVARAAIIRHRVRRGGFWHQNSRAGAFVFSDGTGLATSYRAWGALVAEAWSAVDGKRYTYMDFYMESDITPAPGDAFGGERLDRLLLAISSGAVLATATFGIGDWPRELSRRDAKGFAAQWLQADGDTRAQLDAAVVTDVDREAISRVREQAYLRAFAETQSPEIAGEVSDDFGLIAASLYLDNLDPWAHALWQEYRNQRFPRGKLRKINGLMEF